MTPDLEFVLENTDLKSLNVRISWLISPPIRKGITVASFESDMFLAAITFWHSGTCEFQSNNIQTGEVVILETQTIGDSFDLRSFIEKSLKATVDSLT